MTNVNDLHQFRVQTPSFLINTATGEGPVEVSLSTTFRAIFSSKAATLRAFAMQC